MVVWLVRNLKKGYFNRHKWREWEMERDLGLNVVLVLPSPLIEKEIDKGESYVLGHRFDFFFFG
jgi:hypothetical protein